MSASQGDFLDMNRWQVVIIPLYNATRVGDWVLTSSVEHRKPGYLWSPHAYVCHKWRREPAAGWSALYDLLRTEPVSPTPRKNRST